MTVYHKPKNQAPADVLYVALSKDEGGEGIVSFMSPMGMTPFVFSTKKMMDAAIPMLKTISKEAGKNINIYKFKKSELLESIYGKQ